MGATEIGGVCGDDGCRAGPTETGRGERWYKVWLAECDNHPFVVNNLRIEVDLHSPPGMDYDLFLYQPCGNLVDQSLNGVGQTDTVVGTVSDSLGSDDSCFFYIEIRYYSGDSCSNWNLQTWGDCRP